MRMPYYLFQAFNNWGASASVQYICQTLIERKNRINDIAVAVYSK